jgi:preprotein translocase subunit SecD
MMTQLIRFNIYLSLAVSLILLCGCQSPEHKRHKAFSTLSIHLETGASGMGTEVVPIYRQNPLSLTVEKQPFLTAGNVVDAKVLNAMGGFVLRLQFDHDGKLLLEEYTGANLGRHMAIFCQFANVTEASEAASESKPWDMRARLNKGRWLAAPRINQRISDGVLTFTPDATREEAEQIATGLNNVAKKAGKKGET